MHNQTLSIAVMRVNNPDRSARWNQSLTRSPISNPLAETVCNSY